MSFGKRTEFPTRPSPIHTSASTPQTRRGGYWLGLITVPITQIIVMVIAALVVAPNHIDRLMPIIVVGALSNIIVAAVVLLLTDILLRLVGLRQAWIYALICAVAIYGLSFVVSITPVYRLAFLFFPALLGGLVLGWSRR